MVSGGGREALAAVPGDVDPVLDVAADPPGGCTAHGIVGEGPVAVAGTQLVQGGSQAFPCRRS